jgi:hypothetical protein
LEVTLQHYVACRDLDVFFVDARHGIYLKSVRRWTAAGVRPDPRVLAIAQPRPVHVGPLFWKKRSHRRAHVHPDRCAGEDERGRAPEREEELLPLGGSGRRSPAEQGLPCVRRSFVPVSCRSS